ncbi:MAG: OmpA family protein [Myxococcota bacterium]|nr:OmpA family protein [Myxococcota bacterium]
MNAPACGAKGRLAPLRLVLALLGSASILALALTPARASAQSPPRGIDVQLFTPPAAVGSTFLIDRPAVPRHLHAVFGLSASYAADPFVRVGPDGTQSVVAHLFQGEVLAALGLFEFIELGLALPIAVGDVAEDALAPTLRTSVVAGLSDLRLSMKMPIVRGDFSLSGRLVVGLPTGDQGNFLGMGYWTTTPELVAAWDLGVVRLAGELGYRLRQRRAIRDFEQDDELQIALGGEVPIIPEISIVADTQIRIGTGGRTLRANEVPMDANAGLRFALGEGMTLEAGAGFGILAGYGAPLARGFVTFRYATEREPCIGGPEDFDGFEDGDFCADLDNDRDGVEDAVDRCPNDAEDEDDFADDDGCPDLDNDADGVLDPDDACPVQSEDLDSFQDEDGCPEPDNDEDGIPDGSDQCPMEPEDLDHFQDEDGCPEPGPNAIAVTVTDTRILISERIYFEFDTDTIRPVSMPLLDQVAAVMQQLSPDLRVRIEGHTDEHGNPQYNLDLSFRRARAVLEYLAGRGVPRERLEFRGYGSQHGVAPNDSPEGRALNRRVEFTIIHPTDAPAAGSPRRRRSRGGDAQ